MLLIPSIVGGFVDETCGTLSAPDIDLSIQWPLTEEVSQYLVIEPRGDGKSGQYTISVSYDNCNRSI